MNRNYDTECFLFSYFKIFYLVWFVFPIQNNSIVISGFHEIFLPIFFYLCDFYHEIFFLPIFIDVNVFPYVFFFFFAFYLVCNLKDVKVILS